MLNPFETNMMEPAGACFPMEPAGACFPMARLSEAWTPYQTLGMLFEPSIGLYHGTIFPELVRPYHPHPNSPELY